MNRILEDLKNYGFSSLGRNILSEEETQELGSLINKLFEDKSIDLDMGSCAPVIVNLLGRKERIDYLLEKIVGDRDTQELLFNVLGRGYKIWEVSVRRSEAGDPGLSLHQDAPGQTNLVFSLSENFLGDGGTAFLPKSHRLPRWAQKVSWSNIRIASVIVTPLKVRLGEAVIFFNRTWHLRKVNNTGQKHDVIFFAFFPRGAIYRPKKWIQENIGSWRDPSLRELLDASVGVRNLKDGSIIVESIVDESLDRPYSMSLEDGQKLRDFPNVAPLYMKILFLHMVFFPLKMIYLGVRALRRN